MISLLMFTASNSSPRMAWVMTSLVILAMMSVSPPQPRLLPSPNPSDSSLGTERSTNTNQNRKPFKGKRALNIGVRSPTPTVSPHRRKSKAAKQCVNKCISPSAPELPQHIAALEVEMPISQSFNLEEYKAHEPSVEVDGRRAVVATRTGFIIFFEWLDEYPDRTNANITEIERGYWKETSGFFHEGLHDTRVEVAISGDLAAVGMPDVHTRYGRHAGVVHTFEFNEETNSWTSMEPMTPDYFPFDMNSHEAINDQKNHGFGTSLKLQDGVLVVGAPGASNYVGTIYIFTRHTFADGTKVWVQQHHFTPSDLHKTCPGAIFGAGIQMFKNFIAVGSDCDNWIRLYQYHRPTNYLEEIQGNFARPSDKQRMASAVITDKYFMYSMYDHGVYIYERTGANDAIPPFQFKQFIESEPYNDMAFGYQLVMDENLLIICGKYRLFFFTINEENLWELVVTFQTPYVERGISFSDGRLTIGGPDNVYSMNLKVLLQSKLDEIAIQEQSSDDGIHDNMVEVEIMPTWPINSATIV
mmetsp:Transcript_8646/g.15038  ORF Transcript_8646/g.15038 Transcript_8646/m.15038 type:complete len:528 (+) Transcript_8646:144-1727(+)